MLLSAPAPFCYLAVLVAAFHYRRFRTMKLSKFASSFIAAAAVVVTLTGCQEKEGPAEKAGKEIDKAAASMGQAIENAGEKIQNSAK
jgi:hypothetical protein